MGDYVKGSCWVEGLRCGCRVAVLLLFLLRILFCFAEHGLDSKGWM